MSWYWRTKPRSIMKTIQWFPYFGALEGKNWNETGTTVSCFNQKKVYPNRRSYIYYAHGEEDSWLSSISYEDYLSGRQDQKETESNGRNDKSTFEFFGFAYTDKEGIIHVTQTGHKIIKHHFDQEDFLKQMLKLRLPNPIQKISAKDYTPSVYPMELVLRAFQQFDSLNRSELVLLFGCDHPDKIPDMLQAIAAFKESYGNLSNKQNAKQVKELVTQIYQDYYGTLENKLNSYYDYAEAFSRSLLYTGLFYCSGRSIATKLRVAEHAKKKVELLQKTDLFDHTNKFSSVESYMQWYGSLDSTLLPWEHIAERQELVNEKFSILQNLISDGVWNNYTQTSFVDQEDLDHLFTRSRQEVSISELKEIEQNLDQAITSHNESYFIQFSSKTPKERMMILDRFDSILQNDDMSALWLEVNTWKSLIALQGSHTVKRNFQIEEDLSPRSFAPGVGNTPDMELYYEDMILLPEVSLMTGVRQWEHEASSVVDHLIHYKQKFPEKQVYGLFLSSRIHQRTLWQYFILNRESWLGESICILPLTIQQYADLIAYCYDKELTIAQLLHFLMHLLEQAKTSADFNQWNHRIEKKITAFVSGNLLP